VHLMQRAMLGFHADDVGDWVAELSCLHNQHIRHEPPFREAPWITDPVERESRIGQLLDCPLCDRAELPDGLDVARSSPTWTEVTMPPALGRAHRIAPGVWGVLHVEGGGLRLVLASDPPRSVELQQGAAQPIPPEMDHRVEPMASVRFHLDFLTAHPAGGPPTTEDDR
jgi:tellurite resistance-related uncharacterized protein